MKRAAACGIAAAIGLWHGAAAQGIADPGERAFQYCFSCHSVDPHEAAVLPGPNLSGVIGRPIASQHGYAYSEALKTFAQTHPTWNADLIEQWMQDPQTLAPGTLMEKPPGPRNYSNLIARRGDGYK